MRPGLDRASPDGLLEEGYLLVAADHRRLDADGGAPTTPTRRHGHRSPGGHGKGLAFEWQCQQLLVLDELSRQRMSDRAHQHAAWRRCLLQARRSVDSVASDHAVALDADAPEVDEHLAGLHADPQPELGPALRRELEPEVSHCRLHLEGGSHGAFGVVLVDGRHAEDGQHGIAGELLVPSGLRREAIERPADQGLDQLRVGRLVEAREADEIGKQDGGDLALAPGSGRTGVCGR